MGKGRNQRQGNCYVSDRTGWMEQEETREFETQELIDKMYDGSPDLLVASILGSRKLKREEIERLKKLVEDLR